MNFEDFNLELNFSLDSDINNLNDIQDDLVLEMWPGSINFPPIGGKPIRYIGPKPVYPKPYPKPAPKK